MRKRTREEKGPVKLEERRGERGRSYREGHKEMRNVNVKEEKKKIREEGGLCIFFLEK